MLDEVRRRWSEMTRPQKWMIRAIALIFVSQFFPYVEGSTYYYPGVGGHYRASVPAKSGWSLHPFAPYVLPLLAAIYLTDLRDSDLWQRFGYWLTILLALLCVLPSGEGVGTLFGWIGMIMLGVGAILQHRARRSGSAQ